MCSHRSSHYSSKITLPIALMLPRKKSKDKRIPLTLNWYRNAHFRINNECKKYFSKLINDDLMALPVYHRPIKITYNLYPARRCDTANFCSVIDKFFCDALQKSGKIKDDDFRYLPTVIYNHKEVDPKNPRCVAHIQEIQ